MTTARNGNVDSEQLIACDLGVGGGRAQVERWLRLGRAAGLGRAETEDSLLFRFRDEPATEQELHALVAVDRECCSWADWDVRKDGGELILDVRSTPEGIAALRAMFSSGEAPG